MPSQVLNPGDRVGKYQVLAHIATGGMGTVYKARDEQLGRTVALKVLTVDPATRPSALERFRREARHAARLSHKNIVTLYECGEADGLHFLALEYVKGIDLYEYIVRRGKLAPEEARRILMQAVKALDHAFRQGVTHRDIKPSNFLLTREGDKLRVKLTDLGLARTVSDEEFRVTRAGSTVGTVDYLSPEQARDSASADIRSDIYSLGCTFYQMLTGQPPFSEGGLGERIYKHLEAEPADVREVNPTVSDELWAVLRRMLAKKPEDRYQTPADLLNALKSIPAEADPHRARVPEPPPPPPSPTEKTKAVLPPPSSADVSGDSSQLLTPPDRSAERSGERRAQATPRPQDRLTGDSPDLLGITLEQVQMAARQFGRAQEAQAAGNLEYAVPLLLSCCKIDPSNFVYRQALREVGRAVGERGAASRWLSSLSNLPGKTRLRSARRSGDHRKVLEYGEDILLRSPRDRGTHLSMAESAAALGLIQLAIWLLEEARHQDPEHVEFMRALARLYAKQGQFNQAITLWEAVKKAVPHDGEASQQINNLAASETIARGNYRPVGRQGR
jgi:serine/threonine protein kinase